MGLLDGLFGGGSKSSTTSNTSNVTTNTTTTRDIGFTGDAAVQIFNGINGNLGDLVKSSERVVASNLEFSRITMGEANQTYANSQYAINEQVANLINASRDLSQRALNVASNQDTPISAIPAASASPAPSGENSSQNAILLISVLIGAFALLK